jgi:glycosyltransferase involved in cell wall biosynthesis
MKVCFITTSFKDRSAGDSVYQLAKELVKKGVSVKVVMPHHKNLKYYEEVDGIKIYRFKYWMFSSQQKVAYGRGIPANLKKNLLARIQVPFFIISFIWKTLYASRDCDIIHCFWLHTGFIGSIAKRIYKKPLILMVLGTGLRDSPLFLKKFILRHTDVIISSAPELTELLNEAGLQLDIRDIKHIIDFDKFSKKYDREILKKEFNIHNKYVVTFVARLDSFRDPITFIKSIAYVVSKIDNIEFLLVGGGILTKEINHLIEKLNIQDYIKVMGWCKNVDKILQVTDIFTALSPITNSYAASMLEAITSGVPCIVTQAVDNDPAFKHRNNCFYIPANKEKLLADAIIELVKDEALRKNIVKGGYDFLKELGFNTEIVVNQTINLYNELLT